MVAVQAERLVLLVHRERNAIQRLLARRATEAFRVESFAQGAENFSEIFKILSIFS